MKQTGIKRRIDELGRIVIPRDLREQFKVKPGDNFDIYIEDDRIILEKFSPIDKQRTQLYSMCEVLEEVLESDILFYYNGEIIDPKKEEPQIENITTAFENILSEFHSVSFNDVQLFSTSNETKAGYTYPIIKEGIIMGVFIIFKQLAKLDEKQLSSLKIFEMLLLKEI